MRNPAKLKTLRCAIYTRKSSDEGLEQDFNSLHAQREACGAFIASQRHEGWLTLPALYDDGGYSGGSMERPALRRLLADIAVGVIDVVVVYKVDRLTRSLADFAKIVEVFDGRGVSFNRAISDLTAATPSARRATLVGIVERIIVREGSMEIRFKRHELLDRLVAGLEELMPTQDDTVVVEVPIELAQRGAETRIIVDASSVVNGSREHDAALMKAVARGHVWFENLVNGRVRNIAELAAREGLTDSYVSCLINLAFLAPEIVTGILEGRQPATVTAKGLTLGIDVPISWAMQRETVRL